MQSNVKPEAYTQYPRRFAILAAFAANNALNACMWIAFASIASIVQDRFRVSAGAVNSLSLVFMALYIPGSVAAAYCLERFGLRATLIAGAALNCMCAWVRYAGCFLDDPHAAFAVVMLGQIIGATSQPVWTNAPTRLSGDWFGSSERDVATTVAAMSNPIGNAIGAVVPGLIVFAPLDLDGWMLYQSIAATVVLCITVAVVQDEPPSPPSSSAEERGAARLALEAAAADMRASQRLLAPSGGALNVAVIHHDAHASSAAEALHRLRVDSLAMLGNRNFLLLALGFGIGLGMFNALITIIEQIESPCGYSSEVAALSGGALLLCGLVGAAVMSLLMEKTKQYSILQKVCVLLAGGAMVFMLASLHPGHDAQVVAAFGLLGFFLIPLLPVNLESAAEATYPVPEDNSAAVVLSVGQVFGIVSYTEGVRARVP